MTRLSAEASVSTAVGPSARIGWACCAAVLVAFVAVALANMQIGLHGDPRTTNPVPGPAPFPPFLGIPNWPLVTSITSVLLTVGLFGHLGWKSLRARRAHWLLIVAGAAFFAGTLDPLANWATFTVFDPRVGHFPLSWPYFDIAPLLEPTLSFLGGYASYYALTGVGLLAIYRRLVEPRTRVHGWAHRHPLGAVFVTSFVVGLPLNAVMQFLWLKVGLFVYTQAAGPVLHVADRHLPVLMVIYDSVLFAVVALLCVRDDRGRPMVVTALAQRLPILGARITTATLLLTSTMVLMTAVLVPIAVFSLLRVGGDPNPAYDRWPYPNVKVYDPYGDLERAGKPGPFHQ